MKRQIYRSFSEVVTPHYVSRLGTNGAPTLVTKTLHNITLTIWPDGKPCTLVNIWLDSVASTTMGETDTSMTYAANISHLIRFCWETKVDFSQLEDAHLHEWAKFLVREPHHSESDKRARGNNHCRTILSTALRFLIWYQEKILLKRGKALIGDESSCSSITVASKYNPKSKSYYYTHLSFPPHDIEDSLQKHPISDEQINAILDEISRRKSPNSILENVFDSSNCNSLKLEQQMEYEYERRSFCVWMLERFGSRPSEIFNIPLMANLDIVTKLVIKLPTKKTRRSTAELRSLKISITDAMRYKRYISSRQYFIEFLRSQDAALIEPKGLLLTRYGINIKLGSLNKDFYRLKKTANLLDTDLTQSMYRHRFITYHVLIKFREAAQITKMDPLRFSVTMQLSILKEVAALTGHTDPKSLWAYISVAYGLLKITNSVDSAISILSEAQTFRSSLVGWLRDFEQCESSEDKAKLLYKIKLDMDSLKDLAIPQRGFMPPE